MIFVFEPAVEMPRLPVVNKDFRVLSFVTKRTSESAVIFVGVSEYDAA